MRLKLELAERRPDLFTKLIWSDEDLFDLGGINRQISHFWAEQSSYKLLLQSQYQPRFTVWVAIITDDDGLIGPVILRDTVSAERNRS